MVSENPMSTESHTPAKALPVGALHERLCSACLSRLPVLLSDRFPS